MKEKDIKRFIINIIVAILPLIIGFACFGIANYVLGDEYEICRIEFVLTSLITIAATFAGFVLTSVSILIGLSSSPIMKKIRKNGSLTELRIRYTESLILSVVLVAFCVILGGVIGDSTCIKKGWLMVGVGVLTSYFWSMITTGYYLLSIIGMAPEDSKKEDSETATVPKGRFRV